MTRMGESENTKFEYRNSIAEFRFDNFFHSLIQFPRFRPYHLFTVECLKGRRRTNSLIRVIRVIRG